MGTTRMSDEPTPSPSGLLSLSPLKVIAAFDIGSNSIKMTVARLDPPNRIVEFLWRAETTRLGAGIDESGELSTDRMEASIAVIEAFVAEARRFGARRFVAVATEAIRIARNGEAFLQELRESLGLEVSVVSGDREAELAFLGLDPRIDRSGVLVMADIGGASTEIVEAHEGMPARSISLAMGSGRLTDQFVVADPPAPAELHVCREAAREMIGREPWRHPCDRLVITGGTAEYAQRMLDRDWPATTGDVNRLLDMASTIPSLDLSRMTGANPMRARVLPAGIAIVAAICDLVHPDGILGAASGIRTGLLREAFQDSEP
jgi:exopolyphosphatase / guanosine-5'-triphosphate,3'-diphosphate pyrophosphatase